MTFVTTKEEYENNLLFLHNVHARQFLTVLYFFCDECSSFFLKGRQEILRQRERKQTGLKDNSRSTNMEFHILTLNTLFFYDL